MLIKPSKSNIKVIVLFPNDNYTTEVETKIYKECSVKLIRKKNNDCYKLSLVGMWT